MSAKRWALFPVSLALFLSAAVGLTSVDKASQQVPGIIDVQSITTVQRWCLEDIIVVVVEIPEIVVGCEVIDCCPGCPGPWPIDWRIRFEGGPIETVVLEFENLDPGEMERIGLEGNARWLGANRLQLGAGETFLRGFGARGDRPPVVATPRLELDSGAIRKASAERDARGDAGDFTIVVEQLRDNIVVSEYAVVYRFRWCPPIVRIRDMIDLDNNDLTDNAVVFLDGRRSAGCRDDEVWRGTDIIGVQSVLAKGTCNSEVAVFSNDDAIQLIPDTVWSDPDGDRFPADLTPDRWMAPVSVWVTRANGVAAAQVDIAQANQLYNTNHAGIGFNANIQNLANNQNAVQTIGVPNCMQQNIAALQASNFYTQNTLNVYYVNSATTGYMCIADPNMIVVGTGARPATLAHEFGHSFTLDHVNGVGGAGVDYNADGIADFGNLNVMWGGGIGRTTFSEGQCFRMSLNPNSRINLNAVRTGPTRQCADASVSDTCPWLGLDATPN